MMSSLPSPSPPPPLTEVQKQDMERLWKLQSNEFHDVRIDEDRQSSSSSSSSKKKNQLPPIDSLCMQYLVRLHAFFFAFLQKHSARPSDGAGCNGETEEEEDDEDDEHVEEEKNGNSVSRIAPSSVSSLLPSSSSFLKQSPKESCLESFCSLFVDGSGGVCLRGGRRVLTIHYDEFMQELNTFEFRGKEISDEIKIKKSFAPYLHHFPNRALPALNVSMALATLSVWRRNNRNLLSKSCGNNTPDNVAAVNKANSFLDSSQVIVRLVNVAPVLPMADVKTGLVGKFISVKGHVVKARHRKLRVATADFTCQKCASLVPYSFEKGIFSLPTKCSNKDCKSRSFTLIRPTARYTNVQELRLQEIQEESTSHAGRTPRQIEVELTNDLIDSCRPGDIVLLACFVDAVNSATAAGRTGKRAKETSTYKLFLQGHSITTLSETNHQNGGGGGVKSGSEGSQVTYTQLQLQNITQLCHADHRCLGMIERRAFPFDLLVRSLCPSIIGHHAVKAGILLCLLGGTPPASQQLDRGSSIRSNSHILIVGDPGMGKSQMLLAATQLAARSVYVGGNTASTTGLTVTLTKEEGGETGIEAGALVLADQGVACIDELDKCKHLEGLLEAMEQQCVSIAKAGVVASLPARCSIIAAANPKHGSYNMSKSVAENLNMARPILSRFDLVFILRDRADEDQDRIVSNNIMNLYRKPSKNAFAENSMDYGKHHLQGTQGPPRGNEVVGDENSSNATIEDTRVPLEKRLAWVTSFNEPLPADLVRDYVAYAREYCKPKLTSEASVVLKEYYLNLRHPANGRHRQDSVPITTRQLEALIRLAQARAKACLREFVLKEDALDVVELLKKSVEQVHTDEFGLVDRYRGGAAGQSTRKLRTAFTKELYNLIQGGECTRNDLLRIADRVNFPLNNFDTIIEDMRSTGEIILKSNGKYELTRPY